jgi:hypothetical protein
VPISHCSQCNAIVSRDDSIVPSTRAVIEPIRLLQVWIHLQEDERDGAHRRGDAAGVNGRGDVAGVDYKEDDRYSFGNREDGGTRVGLHWHLVRNRNILQ